MESDFLEDVSVENIEVFAAPDGRYRVVVTRANGSGEEFAFDGALKTMLVTEPGGHQQVALINRDTNFAVMSPEYAKANGYDVLAVVNGRVTHWVKETEHARGELLLDSIDEVAADEGHLTIDIPAGVEVPQEPIDLTQEAPPSVDS